MASSRLAEPVSISRLTHLVSSARPALAFFRDQFHLETVRSALRTANDRFLPSRPATRRPNRPRRREHGQSRPIMQIVVLPLNCIRRAGDINVELSIGSAKITGTPACFVLDRFFLSLSRAPPLRRKCNRGIRFRGSPPRRRGADGNIFAPREEVARFHVDTLPTMHYYEIYKCKLISRPTASKPPASAGAEEGSLYFTEVLVPILQTLRAKH